MMRSRLTVAMAVFLAGLWVLQGCSAEADRFAGYEKVVEETHRASLALREQVLRDVIAEDAFWIKGAWGDVLWCLSALYLDERVEEANARLLERATAYVDAMSARATETVFKPEKKSGISPWGYFALTDYLRILHLFHAGSKHHPGRLAPETEAAMKEAVWWLVKEKSKVKDASLDALLVHHGTENHDLTLRPNYYLAAALLKNDPAFKDRRYDDGHTAAAHFEVYNTYFRAWPRQRAMIGLWFEMGSDTYQKYSWPALFNLHELSPDPMIRKHFGMLMDVALVEEAQVSVRGRRGGGRSRAGYGKNNFEGYKNLLYAPEGVTAGATHHKVFETSTYQAPAAAILLRKMAFPADEPFLIVNRRPGEMAEAELTSSADDRFNAYVADSALINHAYRTPHYLLGGTLQNPALSMMRDGKPVLKYSGISRQNRWSGMLFDDPDARFPVLGALKERADDEMCAVFPEIPRRKNAGRPQHAQWSFAHEDVLITQRIAPGKGMGAYGTQMMSVRFHGRGLEKIEENGWIFASNGKAFVGVRFLDGGYTWDDSGELASPADHTPDSTTRVLFHAGEGNPPPAPPGRGAAEVGGPLLGGVGVGSSGDPFARFRAAVLANPLTIEADRVIYRPGADRPKLECFRYDHHNFKQFKLPRIDGKPVDLRPEWTYRSPYLNGRFGDDKITVTVGPIRRVYDFGSTR